MAPPEPRHWSETVDWIWTENYDDSCAVGHIVLFRKLFHLTTQPKECLVHVSADSRYRLFVNGRSVGFGPAKSFLGEWNYETIDVAPFVTIGSNIIAAQVLRYSPRHSGNLSLIRSVLPGFILHSTLQDVDISTNTSWRCKQDDSVQILSADSWDRHLGPSLLLANEAVEGSKMERGWLNLEFNDATWPTAVISSMKVPMLPILEPRKLVPRTIPALPEIPRRFTRAVKTIGPTGPTQEQWNALLKGDTLVRVAGRSKASVIIDSTVLTTGFLQLRFKGGAGSKVHIRCAECFEGAPDPKNPNPFARNKGDRADSSGALLGLDDFYNVDSRLGEDEEILYEPFWFRTFRYIQLNIESADSAIEFLDFTFRETHYPLDIVTKFSTLGNDEAKTMWEISKNTLRNCMHETYEDCPFYEQNQFAMDARLQMIFTYQLSYDDRLARKCMQEFYSSRRSDGLVETHFPVPLRVISIPYFSLYWILMVHDHMMYFGDSKLVRRYIGTVDGILDHFDVRIADNGLVGRLEWDTWPFVDWAAEWSNSSGDFRNMAVPPAYRRTGFTTYSSLVYAYVLQKSADLCDYIGRRDTGNEYRQRAHDLNDAVRKHCFREDFFVDGPDSPNEERSQHAQVFGVLSGAIKGETARKVLLRALTDTSFVKCSYAMSYYVFEAVKQTGLYEELRESLLDPWRVMIQQNLTTWAESPSMSRSDCHGWSAVPIYDFVANVAGITPAAPGFKRVHFAPRPKIWEQLNGTFAVGPGEISLTWSNGKEVVLTSSFDVEIEVDVQSGQLNGIHRVCAGEPLTIALTA